MGPASGPEAPHKGQAESKPRSAPERRPVAPAGTSGPGAERKILILLILMLICAIVGVAAGVMVIVSRNAPGGGAWGVLLPLLALSS